MNKLIILAIVVLSILSCKDDNSPLPFLGNEEEINGTLVKHRIKDFSFIDQDSNIVDNKVLSQHIYIADFFFTSCPSICPKVTKEMLKIYEEFKDNPTIKIISFTLDPKRDTPNKLKLYSTNLEISNESWLFLTGDKDQAYDLANEYFVVAMEDNEAPGGIAHSGTIALVDKEGHVRSFADGTDPTATPRLIDDIKKLLREYD